MSEPFWPSSCTHLCAPSCLDQEEPASAPLLPEPWDDEVCHVEGPWDVEVGPVTAQEQSTHASHDEHLQSAEAIRRYQPTVPHELRFDTDSAALRPREQFALSGFASSLNKRELPLRVEIIGHADDTGSDVHNQALSESRAKAVAYYLVGHGVVAQVEYEGHGEREPVQANDTPQGREANRRVEINLLPVR